MNIKRCLLLVLASCLLVGNVFASITYDSTKNIFMVAYHDESAGTDAARSGGVITCDYFDDDATVDDAVYFGIYSPCQPFHDLTVYVGTQLVADSITVVWEYPKEGVWTAIPGVTDNTNAFQNAGSNTVSFAVPEDMSHSSTSFYVSNWPTTEDWLWIRCRITAVTNISEGGANSTNSITYKDHIITCSSEASLTFGDIYDADVAGSWGVVSKASDEQYYIEAGLQLDSSNLTSNLEQIIFGKDKYRVTVGGDSDSSWQFGSKNSEGFGYNGSSVKIFTKYTRGSTFYNFSLYASQWWKDLGSWTASSFSDLVDIRDSVLVGDYYYFNSGVESPSYFYRSVYACSYYFYCYTGNIAIDKLYLPYTTVSCDGILLGGSASGSRVDNVELTSGQKIRRYYRDNPLFVNCSFANTDWSNESGAFSLNNSPFAGDDRHLYVYYTFDLTVVDEEGNAIEGARVFLTDGQGNTVIEPTLSGLEFSDTIYNALSPTLMDWASPPAYDADMIGGTVTMTSGTYSGQKTTVSSGGAEGWSGAGYPYFMTVDAICETSATFDFSKWSSGVTDSNGQIDQEECLVWHAWIDESDSWSRQNVDHKDYVLRIEKEGFETVEMNWDFKESQQVDYRIKLRHSPTPGRDNMGDSFK